MGQGPQWEVVLAYNDPATLQDAEEGEGVEEEEMSPPQQVALIDGFLVAAAVTYHEMNAGNGIDETVKGL